MALDGKRLAWPRLAVYRRGRPAARKKPPPQAAGGTEALKIPEEGIKIDLLFTDAVMPDPTGGRKLAERAGEMIPGFAAEENDPGPVSRMTLHGIAERSSIKSESVSDQRVRA